ncbi:MAG: hypothetical protein J7J01_01030 [Methanophagales archaeon]|nr:hypothetical protein [Methanophagales archaeon]
MRGEERKDWEYISKNEFDAETAGFKRVLCNYIRWDFYLKEDGRCYFILSLADSRTKTIAQIALNEEVATALRDAINKLLSGQIEEEGEAERVEAKAKEEQDVMFG